MPQSDIEKFGRWIIEEDFHYVIDAKSPDLKVNELQGIMENKINEIFFMITF